MARFKRAIQYSAAGGGNNAAPSVDSRVYWITRFRG